MRGRPLLRVGGEKSSSSITWTKAGAGASDGTELRSISSIPSKTRHFWGPLNIGARCGKFATTCTRVQYTRHTFSDPQVPPDGAARRSSPKSRKFSQMLGHSVAFTEKSRVNRSSARIANVVPLRRRAHPLDFQPHRANWDAWDRLGPMQFTMRPTPNPVIYRVKRRLGRMGRMILTLRAMRARSRTHACAPRAHTHAHARAHMKTNSGSCVPSVPCSACD